MVYLISSKLNLPSRNTVKESNLTSEIWEKNELNYDEIMQTFFHHVSMTHHPRIRFILLPKQVSTDHSSVVRSYAPLSSHSLSFSFVEGVPIHFKCLRYHALRTTK